MTKTEFVSKITSTTSIEKRVVNLIIDEFMKSIQGSLVQNENVNLRKFGSFIVKHRVAKKAQNIIKKITINVPACNVPAFKPAKEFEDRIK